MKEARDNVEVVEFGGEEWRIESSLGASKIYKDQFRGTATAPYNGNMYHDLIEMYGEVSESDDPMVIPDALFDIFWAMARAAGGTDLPYEGFIEKLNHMSVGFYDVRSLYTAIVVDLADRVTFRLPDGRPDAVEPVDGKE